LQFRLPCQQRRKKKNRVSKHKERRFPPLFIFDTFAKPQRLANPPNFQKKKAAIPRRLKRALATPEKLLQDSTLYELVNKSFR
jgi:hypothetical protein